MTDEDTVYAFAVLRAVPHVYLGSFSNVGVIVHAPTAEFLDRILARLTFPGALYLAAVAALPSIAIAYFGFSQATAGAVGGTSVLIAVGVALDTMRQMESQMMMRSYEGFLK